ncbi:MAG: phage major tail protein, TP901-1 family [Sphingomonadales bacterium]
MAVQSGRAFLLKISDDGDPATYQTVAGLRTNQLTLNSEAVDVTHKGSGGWREILAGAGVKSVSLRGTGIFTGSTAETALQTKLMAASAADCQVTFEDGARFEGPFFVTSIDFTGDHNDARTYSVSLESAGAVSFVSA